MASNDYKRQWLRERRNYLKSIGQYYGSGYDGNSKTRTTVSESKTTDAGQRQEWTPKSRTKYRIVFSDGTPNEIIEATSAKAARAKARTMFGKKKIKRVEEAK